MPHFWGFVHLFWPHQENGLDTSLYSQILNFVKMFQMHFEQIQLQDPMGLKRFQEIKPYFTKLFFKIKFRIDSDHQSKIKIIQIEK